MSENIKKAFALVSTCMVLLSGCATSANSNNASPEDNYKKFQNDPAMQNAKPAEPLSEDQLANLLEVTDFENYLDAPAGWRMDAQEDVDDDTFLLMNYGCDYQFDFGYRDIRTRAFNASQFGPVMVQQIRTLFEEDPDDVIEIVKKDIPACVDRSPVSWPGTPNREDTYEMVDSSAIPNSVVYKISQHMTDGTTPTDNVIYVGFISKDDLLINFFWGLTPMTSTQYAPSEILIDAMTKVSEKQ